MEDGVKMSVSLVSFRVSLKLFLSFGLSWVSKSRVRTRCAFGLSFWLTAARLHLLKGGTATD